MSRRGEPVLIFYEQRGIRAGAKVGSGENDSVIQYGAYVLQTPLNRQALSDSLKVAMDEFGGVGECQYTEREHDWYSGCGRPSESHPDLFDYCPGCGKRVEVDE